MKFFSHLQSHTVIDKVSCGLNFSLALGLNGKCFSWGVNTHGQCGVPINAESCFSEDMVQTWFKTP